MALAAFCYAAGRICFGRKIPDGALCFARGPAKVLRDFVEVRARHGYRTRKVNGRPTKIPGSDMLLVPGVPEAPNQTKGMDALIAWSKWLRDGAPKGIWVKRHD